jgi:glutathione S-transferase
MWMYRLYWARNTGAFAPEAVMTLAGVPFERVAVDVEAGEHRGEAYRRLNPMGQVPLLVLPDGQAMTESAAMLLHLVDRFPQAGLAPAPGSSERAAFDRWLLFMAVNLYGGALRYYYPDRFSTDPAGAEGVKAAAARDLDRWFALVAAALDPGPFLLGARYGAADLYLLMLAEWYAPARELGAIRRLCDALKAEPAVATVCAVNF